MGVRNTNEVVDGECERGLKSCRLAKYRLVVAQLVEQTVREAATICSYPHPLQVDLLTLKVVSESHVTWAN